MNYWQQHPKLSFTNYTPDFHSFDMARKHSKEKWTACPPVGLDATCRPFNAKKRSIIFPSLSGDGSICFSLERAKTSGKMERVSSCFLVAARASSVRKRTAKTRMRVSSASDEQKSRGQKMDGISTCSWEEAQLQKRQTLLLLKRKFPRDGKHSSFSCERQWTSFPFALKKFSPKSGPRFSIHNEICPIMDSISSRSRQKVPERLLLFGLYVLTLLRRSSAPKEAAFPPTLEKNSAPKVNSISFFSKNFTKKGHLFFKETQSKNWQHFSFKNSAPSYEKKHTAFRPDRNEKFGPGERTALPLISSKLQNIESISCFFSRIIPNVWGNCIKMTAFGPDCVEKLGPENGPHRKRTSEKLTAFRAFLRKKSTRNVRQGGCPLAPIPPPSHQQRKIFGPHRWYWWGWDGGKV